MNLLDFIFPKRCVGCGRIGKYFCVACRANIHPIAFNEQICPMCGRAALDGTTHPRCRTRYSLDGLTSLFHYNGIARKAIKAIKYRLVSDLAAEFISLIPCLPSTIYFQRSILIPIPLHAARYRDRGFNQAEVLGNILAKRLPAGKAGLNIPVRTDILRRTKATTPQVEMKKRDDRLKNMERVFSCNHVSGNVILFDDVFTTGATMRSAGSVLKRAGAKRVWAVTMVR